ncbi:MAG TPA: hypothetical protein VMU62_08925, partial [Acidobacteriaceae bacterium]|nr:hypothetical protein [Acidobacteriaceae bacterium]
AFWTVVGLRSAFVSPIDQRANWVFRLIGGRPGYDPLMAAKNWVLLWSTTLTVATGIIIHCIVSATTSRWPAIAGQLLVAIGLCLLLTDAFFLRAKTLPFTGGFVPEQSHLISGIVLYFGFFPTLVIASLGASPWIAGSLGHLIWASLFVIAAHVFLKKIHRRIVMEHVSLLDIDEDQEEFPQRLGLRY